LKKKIINFTSGKPCPKCKKGRLNIFVYRGLRLKKKECYNCGYSEK